MYGVKVIEEAVRNSEFSGGYYETGKINSDEVIAALGIVS